MAANSRVYAEPVDLQCWYYNNEFSSYTSEGCDLGITKQVSVNGGPASDADTQPAGLQARIGDIIVWTITVSDYSDRGLSPIGIVTVRDLLPSGATYVNSSATTGTYSNVTGDWVFTIDESLPATLTITTTANAAGVIENTAAFTDYLPNNCDGPCEDPPFVDAVSANNTNSAFVNVVSDPVVVAATNPVPPSTGFGVDVANPLQTLAAYLAVAAGLYVVARRIRRPAAK
ncbi:MAG: DUF11 domain-containing protein [Patescibacteria group bacterium]